VIPDGPRGPEPAPPGEELASPAFAHASEAELARILDFYAVRWAYEPHTFPILWSLDGSVVESFTPDFYLPDLDLYIELTTLKQKLVRKKNRKLRRLRELYPDVRIKLFYARDFRMLMLKFGRLELFDELTGTTGQVSPARDAITELDESAIERATVPDRGPTVPPPVLVEGRTSRNARRRRRHRERARGAAAAAARDGARER